MRKPQSFLSPLWLAGKSCARATSGKLAGAGHTRADASLLREVDSTAAKAATAMTAAGQISRPVPAVQRLGRNQGGYRGEIIDIEAVLRDVLAAARQHRWEVEKFLSSPALELFALRRGVPNPRRRLYLSAGIHGDEPAGPLAMRQLLQEHRWPDDVALWVCPCLNPAGFRRNTRENAQGIDLNRQYHQPEAPEVVAHVAWLRQQPDFDLTLLLHEDWEAAGFYLYELNVAANPSHAEEIIRRVAAVCPIDSSALIEGRPARDGIIRPSADPTTRPEWPEAFYLVRTKTPHSYTLEAPSDFPLPARVAALVTAVRTVLDHFQPL